MINSLAIATRGRIASSIKRTLTAATLGLILLVGNPTPSNPNINFGGKPAKTDIYNKKKANEKQLLKLSITIDHVKYIEEKEVADNIRVTANNLTTSIDNSKNPRVSVYV
jgi:hypothetical protein